MKTEPIIRYFFSLFSQKEHGLPPQTDQKISYTFWLNSLDENTQRTTQCIAQRCFQRVSTSAPQKGNHPVLIIPCRDFEKVSHQLKPLCKFTILNEDSHKYTKAVSDYLRLKLFLLHEDLHSKTLSDLFSSYTFEICNDNLLADSKALYQDAKRFYRNLPQEKIAWAETFMSFFQSASKKTFPLSLPLTTVDIPANGELSIIEKNLLTAIFSSYPGLCLGENHLMRSPKLFLLENMQLLKDLGVTTLYLEPLLLFSAEELLEDSRILPAIIEQRTLSHDRGQYMPESMGYSAVLQAAKNAGIRLIPIDSQRAYYVDKKCRELNERILTMNMEAYEVIAKHTSQMGKYLVWVGDAHASSPFIDERGQQCDGGIAQSFGIPILYCKDEDNASSTSYLCFDEVGPFNTPKIYIHRSLFPHKSSMSEEELQILDMLGEKEENADRKTLERALITLYRLKDPQPMLVHKVKKALSAVSETSQWLIPSKQPLPDIVNFVLAENFLAELESPSAEVRFDKSHLHGLINGGTCTALSLQFLSHYLLLSTIDSNLSAKEKAKKTLSYILNGQEAGAIQAAMNAIYCLPAAETPSASKIEALIRPYNMKIMTSSQTVTIGSQGWEDLLKQEIEIAKQSPILLLRLLLPKDNHKREEHGHTTLLMKEGNHWTFYDPNSGVKFIRCDKLYDGLKNTLQQQHISFNIPALTIYALSQDTKYSLSIPRSITFNRLEKEQISIDKLTQLPEAIMHLILLEKEAIHRLMQAGVSLEDLAQHPSSILFLITSKWKSFIELTQAGYEAKWLLQQQRPQLLKLLSISEEILLEDRKKANLLYSVESLGAKLHNFPALASAVVHDQRILALCGYAIPLKKPAIEDSHISSKSTPIAALALSATIQQSLQDDSLNLKEKIEESGFRDAITRFGDEALPAIHILEKKGLSPTILYQMNARIARPLLSLAKDVLSKPYYEYSLQSVVNALKKEAFEKLFLTINNENLLVNLAYFLKKDADLQYLLSLPSDVLQAIVIENTALSTSQTAILDKLVAQSCEDIVLLLRKTEHRKISSILLLCPTTFSAKELAHLPPKVTMAILNAADPLLAVEPNLRNRFIKEKIFHDWIDKFGTSVVQNLLLFLEAGSSIDDIRHFSYSQYFPLLLNYAPSFCNALKKHGLHWKVFFGQSSLEKFILSHGYSEVYITIQGKLPFKELTACVKLSDLLTMHSAGLTLDALSYCSDDLVNKILQKSDAIAQNLDYFDQKSIRPNLSKALSDVRNLISLKPSLLDIAHNIINLSINGFDLSLLQAQSDAIIIALAGSATELDELPTPDCQKLLNDPFFPPLFEKASKAYYNLPVSTQSSALGKILHGLLQHHQISKSLQPLYQLIDKNKDMRLRDLILCTRYISKELIHGFDGIAFFSSVDVQQLLDKTSYKDIVTIIHFFNANFNLTFFASLSPEILKHVLNCSIELIALHKEQDPKWVTIFHHQGLLLLIEKCPEQSLGKIIKLYLSGFSIQDLIANPCLLKLLNQADALYSLKDVAITSLPISEDATDRSTLFSIMEDTSTTSKHAERCSVNTSVLLDKVLKSENPTYLISPAVQFPEITELVLENSALFHDFIKYECIELLILFPKLIQTCINTGTSLKYTAIASAFKVCQQILQDIDAKIMLAHEEKNTSPQPLSFYLSRWAKIVAVNQDELLTVILGLRKTTNSQLALFVDASQKMRDHFYCCNYLLTSTLAENQLHQFFSKIEMLDPLSREVLMQIMPYFIHEPSRLHTFKLPNFSALFYGTLLHIHNNCYGNHPLPSTTSFSSFVHCWSENLGISSAAFQQQISASLINQETTSISKEAMLVADLIRKCELVANNAHIDLISELNQKIIHPDVSLDKAMLFVSFVKANIGQLPLNQQLYKEFLLVDYSNFFLHLCELDKDNQQFWMTHPYRLLFGERKAILKSKLALAGWLPTTLLSSHMNLIDDALKNYFPDTIDSKEPNQNPLDTICNRIALGLNLTSYKIKNALLLSLQKEPLSSDQDLISLISRHLDQSTLASQEKENLAGKVHDILLKMSCFIDTWECVYKYYEDHPGLSLNLIQSSSTFSRIFMELNLSAETVFSATNPHIQYAIKKGLGSIIILSQYPDADALDKLKPNTLRCLSEWIDGDLCYFLEKARDKTIPCTRIVEVISSFKDFTELSTEDFKEALEKRL